MRSIPIVIIISVGVSVVDRITISVEQRLGWPGGAGPRHGPGRWWPLSRLFMSDRFRFFLGLFQAIIVSIVVTESIVTVISLAVAVIGIAIV